MLFSDIVGGSYYKGWDGLPPTGVKAWFYCDKTSTGPSGFVYLDFWYVNRTTANTPQSFLQQWIHRQLYGNPGDTVPLIKRDATDTEILLEGFACPPIVGASASRTVQGGSYAAIGRALFAQGSGPAGPIGPTGGQIATAQSPATHGVASATAKTRIPENCNRVSCFKCSNPTKTVVLFTGTSNYCPICEP